MIKPREPVETKQDLDFAPMGRAADFDYARRIILTTCRIAGASDFVNDAKSAIPRQLFTSSRSKANALLFSHLVWAFNFQGVSDATAETFLRQNERITRRLISSGLGASDQCEKLSSYWSFFHCNYHKNVGACAAPDRIADCPLPRHRLRNGRLNQTAYSLYLFMRDVANGDLLSWIDRTLTAEIERIGDADSAALAASIIRPMREIFGVSDKILTMSLSDILIASGELRPLWPRIGGSMIVIDTLVHNFFHRTGITNRLGKKHVFGVGCYQPNGCAAIVRSIASTIDATMFNPTYPPDFSRFVQHAIWRYCAQAGLDICNGNRIDDRQRCEHIYCRLYEICDRVSMRPRSI